ncbi:hypothetical protein [Rugamonas aquatica]|uniref:Uncharacterized protein n=1 Tax=Rugamonas aquatica TaxID=2743357 RepID=A0A6A7N6D8_9BURK|nr:hypothetical protein [Rugamonas aquatica]MQA40357.1 hypothetical protein [Rugamonas aquatica]
MRLTVSGQERSVQYFGFKPRNLTCNETRYGEAIVSNLEAYAPLVNGDVYPMHEVGEACRLFINRFLGDDLRPPPRSITLSITTESGRQVRIVVPNDLSSAVVFLDDEKI